MENKLFHPFCWLSPHQEKIIFFLALAGTITVMCVLSLLDQDLKTGSAPLGILSFEFAGDLSTAKMIIKNWGESDRALAGFHLGLDYLFLILYPAFISLGCALAATHLWPRNRLLTRISLILSWLQILAGLLDAVENWALLRLLMGSVCDLFPLIAWWCAAGKFAIVSAGLALLLLALVTITMAKFKSDPEYNKE